jgi:RNA polymerase sigma factor (sigma-70 family)
LSLTGDGKYPDSVSDEDLVAIATEDPGSERAGEAASVLFGRYRRRVYMWCYQYVRDHEKAMDLAQDALLSAYRNLATFRKGGRFNSWLYAIARNRCYNELRRPAIWSDEEVDLDSFPATEEDPGEILLRKLDADALLRMIHENLDELEQDVIWLRCFERMPIDMITRVLAIRQASGARGILQRARRTLRAAIDARRSVTEG